MGIIIKSITQQLKKNVISWLISIVICTLQFKVLLIFIEKKMYHTHSFDVLNISIFKEMCRVLKTVLPHWVYLRHTYRHKKICLYRSNLSTSENRIAATPRQKTFANRLRSLAIISQDISTVSLFYLFMLDTRNHLDKNVFRLTPF